jgi:chemotaxis protein CheD
MIRYREDLFDLPAVRIVAGEYFVTSQDMVIATLLGSCVAACVRDPHAGIVGMNHFMLPAGNEARSNAGASYGIPAMNHLIDVMVKRGANPAALEAKVFGGGVVMGSASFLDVGRLNAEFVIEYLKERGIAVLAADLRGLGARKIYFVQRTGSVFVRHLTQGGENESAGTAAASGETV